MDQFFSLRKKKHYWNNGGKYWKSQGISSVWKVGTMPRESVQMSFYSVAICYCKEIGMSMIIVIFLVGVMKDIIRSPELRILLNV